jgi:hypothetical protein
MGLGRPLGATTPDFFYEPRNDAYEGLCIYLDGMGRHLHGRPETRDRDRDIREGLRFEDLARLAKGRLTTEWVRKARVHAVDVFRPASDSAAWAVLEPVMAFNRSEQRAEMSEWYVFKGSLAV